MIRSIFCFLVFCPVFFCGGLEKVHAYTLPANRILEMTAKNLGKAKRLYLTQKLNHYHMDRPDEPTTLVETLLYRFPHSFRSEITTEAGHRTHLFVKGRSLTVSDGRIQSETESWLDRYKDLLLCDSKKRLYAFLKNLGIDTEISSLGRFGKKGAYVIGAEYPDTSRPQLWVDKEMNLPIRLIMPAATEKGSVGPVNEIRYEGWEKAGGRIFYPRKTEWYENELLIRDVRVDEIQVNPVIDSGLFRIDLLKAKSLPPLPPGTPDPYEGKKDDEQPEDEVQRTIDDFLRRFETEETAIPEPGPDSGKE